MGKIHFPIHFVWNMLFDYISRCFSSSGKSNFKEELNLMKPTLCGYGVRHLSASATTIIDCFACLILNFQVDSFRIQFKFASGQSFCCEIPFSIVTFKNKLSSEMFTL